MALKVLEFSVSFDENGIPREARNDGKRMTYLKIVIPAKAGIRAFGVCF
jgi:hypothetical protein